MTVIDKKKLPAKQYPTLEGLKTVLNQLPQKDAKVRAAKPQDFIDAGCRGVRQKRLYR